MARRPKPCPPRTPPPRRRGHSVTFPDQGRRPGRTRRRHRLCDPRRCHSCLPGRELDRAKRPGGRRRAGPARERLVDRWPRATPDLGRCDRSTPRRPSRPSRISAARPAARVGARSSGRARGRAAGQRLVGGLDLEEPGERPLPGGIRMMQLGERPVGALDLGRARALRHTKHLVRIGTSCHGLIIAPIRSGRPRAPCRRRLRACRGLPAASATARACRSHDPQRPPLPAASRVAARSRRDQRPRAAPGTSSPTGASSNDATVRADTSPRGSTIAGRW